MADPRQALLDSEGQVRAAVNEAVNQELMRAGVGYEALPGWRRKALIDSLMSGEPDENAKQLLEVLQIGDGLSMDGREDIQKRYGDMHLFGVPAEEIWDNQRRGWDDYGWTQEKVDKLGRLPEARELSRGGREAWNWKRRRDFLEAIAGHKAKAQESAKVHRGQQDAYTFGLNRALESDSDVQSQKRLALMRSALRDYDANRDRTHGESGWDGALQNPEYAVGNAMTNYLTPTQEAAWKMFYDSFSPEAAGEQSPMENDDILAVFAKDYMTEAKDLADNRTRAYAVEPSILKGRTPADSRKLLAGLSQADVPNYDEWHRMTTGQYPTYAGSSVMTFLNGLLDPSLPLGSLAAKGAVATGKAMAGAGLKAGAMNNASGLLGLLSRGLTKYGVSVAKDARPLSKMGMLAGGLSEFADEGLTNVGLNAGLVAYDESEQPTKVNERTSPPLPNPLAYGNTARTDMYVWDPKAEVKDQKTGQVSYGNWVEESQRDFERRMLEKNAARQQSKRITHRIHKEFPQAPQMPLTPTR